MSQIWGSYQKLNKLKIKGLDLHFDGHNGDHLLLFIRTNQNIIYLTGIGTHSELFLNNIKKGQLYLLMIGLPFCIYYFI